MPPVLIHVDDPIVPGARTNSTNQTDDSSLQQQASYPPARPGAVAGPAPTSYAPAPQPQLQPSRTTAQTDRYAPPPPQPGAVPTLPSQQNVPQTAPSLPPPPKAGEVPQAAPVTTMPPQMGIPPPQQNYAPAHSTVAEMPQTAAYPQQTTLNLGRVSGPPAGYQQNSFAQEISSGQRASLEQHEQREGYTPASGFGAGTSANDTAGNVWNAVKGWANVAGTKLAETEEEVWKRINGKK